jgi:hypothetical protein
MVSAFAILLLTLVSSGETWSASTHTRIRPLNPLSESVIIDAARRSPTVARLLEQIERTNVVVYITARTGLAARGVLNFMGHGEPTTYVRVGIDLRQTERDRTATLAHELTHALEIAESDSPIESEADLFALYRRIGIAGDRRGQVESERCRAIEAQVRREAALGATTSAR